MAARTGIGRLASWFDRRVVGGARDLAFLAGSPLPRPLRAGLFRSWLSLHLQRGRTDGDGLMHWTLLGRRVCAHSRASMALQFREIFLRADYYLPDLGPRPFILDAGANAGLAILFFKTVHPGAELVGFEPNPESFALLERNTVGSGLDGVTLHPVAVGAADGSLEFFLVPGEPASNRASSRPGRTGGRPVSVPQRRLSAFVDRPVDLLKLDVEGAEAGVLDDLIQSGAIARVRRMVIEYHHHIQGDRDAFGHFLGRLEAAGFGYQLRASLPPGDPAWRRGGTFQDVLVYACRPGDGGGQAG
ncbi:MAG: FkbM family methyltransferase [Hyphomicrobiales bacterium]|nr:FkbM family methyltransferase [Hyphomicrobiales bacterium]